MSAIEVLVSTILLATAPTDYPARIGSTSAALADIALEYLTTKGSVDFAVACEDLYHRNETRILDVSNKGLSMNETTVLGFFLYYSRGITDVM